MAGGVNHAGHFLLTGAKRRSALLDLPYAFPQHRLNFLPLPQGQGSLRLAGVAAGTCRCFGFCLKRPNIISAIQIPAARTG